ncbi:MAG: hypothetical protein KGH53_02100 [Candidatus Micrarchaeota archaeon]|nr:hypothetical protein [Candidatus Micrarchaeota archaeon]
MLEVKERAKNEFTDAYGAAYDYVQERRPIPKWSEREIMPIEKPSKVFSIKTESQDSSKKELKIKRN